MGYERHNAILVTTYRRDYIERAHEEALRLFDLATCGPMVSEIYGEVTNGYYSFAVFPDGSKEGWPDSTRCDGKRERFKLWLHAQECKDGSSSYSWVEVQFGDDDLETKIINDGDETRRNRRASEEYPMLAQPGLPPMDASWWQEYHVLYREVFAIQYRLINHNDGTVTPDEVYHLGLFMGMTSRIKAKFGQESET